MWLCRESWPRYRREIRYSRGQGGRSGGCIDVAAPWPYVSRGGVGCHSAPGSMCPQPDLKPNFPRWPKVFTGHLQAQGDTYSSGLSTFLLWNKVNTEISTEKLKENKDVRIFWRWRAGEEIPQLDEVAPFRMLGDCHSSWGKTLLGESFSLCLNSTLRTDVENNKHAFF